MSASSEIPLWRRLAFGLLLIAAPVPLLMKVHGDFDKLALPALSPLLAALVVHLPRLGPQLMARSIAWANALLGVVLAVLGGSTESTVGAVLCGGSAAALALLGRQGLAQAAAASGRRAVAFPGTLLLLMVLTLADAQTYTLFAVLLHFDRAGMGLALGAAAMIVGFVGLYRVEIWGAVVSVGASVLLLLAYLVVYPHSLGKDHMNELVGGMSFAQIVAGAPMLFAIATERKLPRMPPVIRLVAGPVFLGLVTLLAVGSAIHHGRWPQMHEE